MTGVKSPMKTIDKNQNNVNINGERKKEIMDTYSYSTNSRQYKMLRLYSSSTMETPHLVKSKQ